MERLLRIFSITSAIFTFSLIIFIFFFLLKESIGAPIGVFFNSLDWSPSSSPPLWGIAALIISSLIITAIGLSLALPFSLFAAVFITYYTRGFITYFLKSIIEFLVGIPSVALGVIGLLLIAPTIKELFNLSTGLCLFTTGIVVGFMAIPILLVVIMNSLASLPHSYLEASLAMGASLSQTIFKLLLPLIKRSIISSIMLGSARIIGETMIAVMLSGGCGIFPNSIFSPGRPLTAAITLEIGECLRGSLHYHALFSVGLILFLLCLIFNLASLNVEKREFSR
jgi:phosphate transport system permease protein